MYFKYEKNAHIMCTFSFLTFKFFKWNLFLNLFLKLYFIRKHIDINIAERYYEKKKYIAIIDSTYEHNNLLFRLNSWRGPWPNVELEVNLIRMFFIVT